MPIQIIGFSLTGLSTSTNFDFILNDSPNTFARVAFRYFSYTRI